MCIKFNFQIRNKHQLYRLACPLLQIVKLNYKELAARLHYNQNQNFFLLSFSTKDQQYMSSTSFLDRNKFAVNSCVKLKDLVSQNLQQLLCAKPHKAATHQTWSQPKEQETWSTTCMRLTACSENQLERTNLIPNIHVVFLPFPIDGYNQGHGNKHSTERKQTAIQHQSMDAAKAMETNTPWKTNLPLPSMPRTLGIVTKHANPQKL